MKKELKLVSEFHKKFKAPILESPQNSPEDRYQLRYELMHEEVQEYLEGVYKGDVENVAKKLADVLYTVYGTVLEHGPQGRMEEIFEEVHRSHMTRDYSTGK